LGVINLQYCLLSLLVVLEQVHTLQMHAYFTTYELDNFSTPEPFIGTVTNEFSN